MIDNKRILILGATGPLGILGVRAGLKQGHNITIYARTPSKIPDDLTKNPNVKVITGDLSESDIKTNLIPILPSHDAIISYLGPSTSPPHKGHPWLDFWTFFIPLLQTIPATSRPYLLVLSTLSLTSPKDKFNFTTYLLVKGVQLFFSSVYNEIRLLQKFWDDIQSEGSLKVTVFRVGMLTNGELIGNGARAGYIGQDGFGTSTSRWDIATWSVKEALEKKWVGDMPAIYAGVKV